MIQPSPSPPMMPPSTRSDSNSHAHFLHINHHRVIPEAPHALLRLFGPHSTAQLEKRRQLQHGLWIGFVTVVVESQREIYAGLCYRAFKTVHVWKLALFKFNHRHGSLDTESTLVPRTFAAITTSSKFESQTLQDKLFNIEYTTQSIETRKASNLGAFKNHRILFSSLNVNILYSRALLQFLFGFRAVGHLGPVREHRIHDVSTSREWPGMNKPPEANVLLPIHCNVSLHHRPASSRVHALRSRRAAAAHRKHHVSTSRERAEFLETPLGANAPLHFQRAVCNLPLPDASDGDSLPALPLAKIRSEYRSAALLSRLSLPRSSLASEFASRCNDDSGSARRNSSSRSLAVARTQSSSLAEEKSSRRT
ncbi:hypothetical protein C8R43DRAFT_1137527 [Mycena crocata]|nr:hypothetical protein C8R43DRAFT_1137527 [Mycena crocata]